MGCREENLRLVVSSNSGDGGVRDACDIGKRRADRCDTSPTLSFYYEEFSISSFQSRDTYESISFLFLTYLRRNLE